MIRSGEMTCPLVLQQPPPRDGFELTGREWTDGETLWGRPVPRSGAERYVDPTVLATAQYVFATCYHADVRPGSRFRFRNRLLNCTSVLDPTERQIELLITAVELVE